MTITFGWNIIPIIVTLISLLFWAFTSITEEGGGCLSGLGCVFSFMFGGFLSTSAWLIYVLAAR